MAQPGVPLNVFQAARQGDAGVVQEWLENGGDANLDLSPETFNGIRDVRTPWSRLLSHATEHGRLEVMRVLLAYGANVNDPPPGPLTSEYTALEVASTRLHYDDVPRYDAVSLLIENGADASLIMESALLNHRLLRILLVAGADVSVPTQSSEGMDPETYARSRRDHYVQHPSRLTRFEELYGESVMILEGSRLAGSYKNYVLQEYKELLRLRSLLARKRASIGPTTPEVVARLFGGRADPAAPRRATRRRRPLPQRPAGVPGPVFWKVMEYWRLGDWRHPERHL